MDKELVFERITDLDFKDLKLNEGDELLIVFDKGDSIIATMYDIDHEWIMYNVGEGGYWSDNNQIDKIYRVIK